MSWAAILLVALAAQASDAPAPPAATPSRPVTSYDCSLTLATPNGEAQLLWRLLPDGQVIEHSGHWVSTWHADAVRIWLGWSGTGAEPLRPESLASISVGGSSPGRRDGRRRVRMELRVPGSRGNLHWFAFATPYRAWNEVAGTSMIYWGELLAFSRGAGRIEIRIVDPRGRVLRTAILELPLVEEAERGARDAQAAMIAMAAAFRERCEPYDGDPYNRDIVLTGGNSGAR